MADALRSGRSVLTDVWVQIPPRHQRRPLLALVIGIGKLEHALVAQWIERCPAEAEVVGSNPAKRAITRQFPSLNRSDGPFVTTVRYAFAITAPSAPLSPGLTAASVARSTAPKTHHGPLIAQTPTQSIHRAIN